MHAPAQNSDGVVEPPVTSADLEIYYRLRYEVLRKPWKQPEGSERDAEEDASIHALIQENGKALAVGRLQFLDTRTSQIRYMAVEPGKRGKGLGRKIMEYLEARSREAGRNKVVLHARENALKFYVSCGYIVRERSHLLWGEVQHWLMEKELH